MGYVATIWTFSGRGHDFLCHGGSTSYVFIIGQAVRRNSSGDAILFYAGGSSISNNHGNGNGHEPVARKVAITKLPSLRDNARL